jgi:K(+)-stimulated pyrophosphate-energized sodium pump
VGDTVGDPFKDTTSVALNPIIKFSTLFGLLAVEIAVNMKLAAKAAGHFDYTVFIGMAFLAIALVFVYRSFYSMRITTKSMKNERRNDHVEIIEESVEELVEDSSRTYTLN